MALVAYGKTAVVSYVGTLDDGTVFSSTADIEPLEFVVGSGSVIHGFDETVASMSVGDKKKVSIEPGDAFGEYDAERIEVAPMYSIPNAKDLTVGKLFYFKTEEGLNFPAKILEINEGLATVDFNHPYAGKTLNFEIELLEVKD